MSEKYIDATELADKQKKGETYIIDVREPDEYQSEHIEGSINIPLSTLDPCSLARLSSESKKKYIFQCASGKRATEAFQKVSAQDSCSKECAILEGGISAWKQAGLSTQSGTGSLSLFRKIQIIAGFFVFLGTVLGLTIHSGFFGIPLFFGCGLFFAGVTGWCGMAILLKKLGLA